MYTRDKLSANKINALNVPIFKIAPADLTNFDLLEHIIRFNKPIIISTGMSTEEEINKTVNFLKINKSQFYLIL